MSDMPEPSDQNPPTTAPDDTQVADYLRNNIRFFEENPELLDGLAIPHRAGGSVSLIERQVASLREENTRLKRQLSTLIKHAHDNDTLFGKTRALSLQLMQTRNYDQLRECIETAMVDEFNATVCRLWWLGANSERAPALEPGAVSDTLTRMVGKDEIFCGLLRKDESALLFGEQANQAASAAVLTLHHDDELIAVLAIANEDRDYYRDSMGTSMLSYIGELLTQAMVMR